MSIEENIARIADALERLAATQEENTKINQWYKEHLAGKNPVTEAPVILASKVEEVPRAEAQAEAKIVSALADAANGVVEAIAAVEAPSSPVITREMIEAAAEVAAHPIATTAYGRDLMFDELKLELLARGHAYKKGTKTTTLQKEWDKHKFEPIIGAKSTPSPLEPPQSDVNPTGYAPSLTEAPAKQDKPDLDQLEFFTEKSEVKPMTQEEAIARIVETYMKPEDKPEEEKKFDLECMRKALESVGVQSIRLVPVGKFEQVVSEYERLKGIAHA